MKRKNTKKYEKFKELVREFVEKIERGEEADKKLYKKIMTRATASDADIIIQELINKVKVFSDYDEDDDVLEFDYIPYVDMLIELT